MTKTNLPAIEVHELARRFGSVEAVSGASFTVNSGEIYGFLGPNGAGKTTTINMLTGLARPMSGRIAYFGRDYTANIKKAQHLMGIVLGAHVPGVQPCGVVGILCCTFFTEFA